MRAEREDCDLDNKWDQRMKSMTDHVRMNITAALR